jgi:prepilin-type N-terminal cleavage/methylation domain-containing protein
MNTCEARERTENRAFTLIELLVVFAIIGILAAIIVPLAGTASARAKINLAKAQLANVETALAAYKDKRGVYPPDNPANPALNALFYELTGTTYDHKPPQVFWRLHGGETINLPAVQAVFGIGGFINSSFVANRQDTAQLQEAEVRDFFPGLQPKQYLVVNSGVQNLQVAVLGLDVDGPGMFGNSASGKRTNPWRYVSSNPVNSGPGSFDLWVDIIIRGQTNRISNWSQEPQIVHY